MLIVVGELGHGVVLNGAHRSASFLDYRGARRIVLGAVEFAASFAREGFEPS